MIYNFLINYIDTFSFLNIIRYITFRGACAFFTSFFFTLFMMPMCIRWLISIRCRQEIHKSVEAHQCKSGTPTMGGILIVFSVLCSALLWTDLSNHFIWYTLIIFLSFASIGFLDDYIKIKNKHNAGLSARMKFLLQFIISMIIMYLLVKDATFTTTITLPFFKNISPDIGLFYIPFGAFVLIGASNAVNLTDGLDGLAIGSSGIAASSLAIFLYIAGNYTIASYLQVPFIIGVGEVSIIAVALLGSAIGFLWYNAHPAEVFMGDVGSLSIGGLLGFFAILAKQEILLVIIGGLFVIETLSVILQVSYFKISKGKRIFLMAPLHHHFEKKGIPESKLIIRFWLLAIMCSLIALASLKLR